MAAEQLAPSIEAVAADEEEEEESFSSELSFILHLAARRIRRPRFRLKHAFGSIVTQLGKQAFVVIVSFLSLTALIGQQVARRIRNYRLDSSLTQLKLPAWLKFAVPDLAVVLDKSRKLVKDTTDSLKYENIANKVFNDFGDLDGDGMVDANELYAMSLKLYCTTTNYLPQVLTPPPLSHVQTLFRTFDVDESGTLNRDEFVLLASVWFENCALRIAAQSTISLVLAPFTARSLTRFLAGFVLYTQTEMRPAGGGGGSETSRAPWWTFGIQLGGPPMEAVDVNVTLGDTLASLVPDVVAPYVAHQTFVKTTIAASLVASLVPATLGLLDEYYSMRAARKTSRANAKTPAKKHSLSQRFNQLDLERVQRIATDKTD